MIAALSGVRYLTPHGASRESCKPDLHFVRRQSCGRYDRKERGTPNRPALPIPGERRTPVSGYCLTQVQPSGAAEVVVALAGTPILACASSANFCSAKLALSSTKIKLARFPADLGHLKNDVMLGWLAGARGYARRATRELS